MKIVLLLTGENGLTTYWWKWSYYLLVKLVEMVLLDRMVQPLAQPSKLTSGTTENYLTWKVSQAVKIIPLVILIQLVEMVQPVI